MSESKNPYKVRTHQENPAFKPTEMFNLKKKIKKKYDFLGKDIPIIFLQKHEDPDKAIDESVSAIWLYKKGGKTYESLTGNVAQTMFDKICQL